MHLRPDLYRRLNRIRRLGGVVVANENEEMVARVSQDGDRKSLQVRERGEAYRVNCPFCTDTRHRLWINHLWGYKHPETGTRNLWLCICYNENCLQTYERQRKLFDMVYDDTLPPTDDELVRNHEEILETPDQVDWPGEVVPIDSLPSDHPAVQYLESRNFPVSVLSSALGVKYCTSAENRYRIARDRIIIPLFMHGKMKAWQARYVGTPPLKSVVKYWTTPKVKKKALLYNFDVARSRKFVVLTEGPTDVWRFGPEAVSILGHKASSTQLQLITANWDRVVVLLDPDASDDGVGIYDILRNCGKASLQVALVELTGSDPGDMATADLRNFVFSEAYRQGVILETT